VGLAGEGGTPWRIRDLRLDKRRQIGIVEEGARSITGSGGTGYIRIPYLNSDGNELLDPTTKALLGEVDVRVANDLKDPE